MPRETTFEELRRYVRFDDVDASNLRALHPHAAPHFARIAAEFYERIREHEGAHAVFTGEAQIERLRLSMIAWLDRICTSTRDEVYAATSARIGEVHVRIGLPQRYVFAAMALIRGELEALNAAAMGDAAPAVRASVNRALDLELALMMESYADDFAARRLRLERLEADERGRPSAGGERRYERAVERAPFLFVGLDDAGAIRTFNREAEHASGRLRDEVIGVRIVDALFASDEVAGRAFFARPTGLDRALTPPMELELRTRAGGARQILWQRAPLEHEPQAGHELQDPIVEFAIGRDVTNSRMLADRTRNADRLAAVGTLAAGLAHEIRNPLNGAQLHITLLERELRGGKARVETIEAVAVVAGEIQRLSRLVTEFLDFARPAPLTRRRVAMRTLCQRVIGLAAAEAERAAVALVTDFPATSIDADVDAEKIEQMLLNLLRNGIEAMRDVGGGRVTLRLRRAPFHARIEVEDEGPGLPRVDAPIFDPFFSTKHGGTGLGLSIVHRIVADHGGTVVADARPGRTVFAVTIPITSLGESSP